jgi:hypothetical protein|tara:strand:- start:350 stop:979 length:630 start_codon:yes stop_codon:yes gene_type:complete
MAQSRKGMPSKNTIKKYWNKDSNGDCRIRFIGDFGWKELPTNTCWRCGEEGNVERAHIWAKSDMELYTDKTEKEIHHPSNLHLLCKPCHKVSELLSGWEPGLAYYECFYTLRTSVKHAPLDPQVWNENRFWYLKLMNRIAEDIGIDVSRSETELTEKELKKLKKWLSKWSEQNSNGGGIFDEKRNKRFKKLSKKKGLNYTDYMLHEGIF